MLYRQHRGAGLSVIGLGAWQFGGEWGKDFNAERGRPAGGPGG
jgi:aryl-alcohol dehydrogenase-like predicted oxidoreductase